MLKPHTFEVSVSWEVGDGDPTTSLRAFSRDSVATTPGIEAQASSSAGARVGLEVSAAKAFFGDPSKWNPETLLLAALGQCHLLSFLRAAGVRGYEVTHATIDVRGELALSPDGSGRFTFIEMQPASSISGQDPETDAETYSELHEQAHAWCFIANSIACEIVVHPDTGGLQRVL